MTSWQDHYKKINKEVNELINNGFLEDQEKPTPLRLKTMCDLLSVVGETAKSPIDAMITLGACITLIIKNTYDKEKQHENLDVIVKMLHCQLQFYIDCDEKEVKDD